MVTRYGRKAMSNLAEKHCVPCRGGVAPLQGEQLSPYSEQLPDWKIVEEHHIAKSFRFPDFKAGLDFVNRVGAVGKPMGIILICAWRGARWTCRSIRTKFAGLPRAILLWPRRSTKCMPLDGASGKSLSG